MRGPLLLDPTARDATDWERRGFQPSAIFADPFAWTCIACGDTFNRPAADGLVPCPAGAKALCDGCLVAAKETQHGPL